LGGGGKNIPTPYNMRLLNPSAAGKFSLALVVPKLPFKINARSFADAPLFVEYYIPFLAYR
jgi:hypothetical protein